MFPSADDDVEMTSEYSDSPNLTMGFVTTMLDRLFDVN